MMIDTSFLDAPSELDFLEAFGVEPEDAKPSDGFWRYRFECQNDLSLVLSFDLHAGSIQTMILVAGQEVSTVVHEYLKYLRILEVDKKPRLVGVCKCKEETTELVAEIYPRLCVRWSSLQT